MKTSKAPKFNIFPRVCWFLGKNLPYFVPPIWKIHNPYCHNVQSSRNFGSWQISVYFLWICKDLIFYGFTKVLTLLSTTIAMGTHLRKLGLPLFAREVDGKGELISESIFGIIKFPKNQHKNFMLYIPLKWENIWTL